jgi:hypothetical protein
VDRVFVFVAPQLITLVLATLLMLLFVRGHMIELKAWLSSDRPAMENIAHALTLFSLFFASAQAFNSVLPERGLLFWLFSFFFLWTLWNNQFSSFDPKRLLRSLTVLFATAFVLKHMLLASLYAPEGGWVKRLAGVLLEGVSLGTLDAPAFAPATGYISFFTLALYIAGLLLLPSAPDRLEVVAGPLALSDRLELASIDETTAIGTGRKPDREDQLQYSIVEDADVSEESAKRTTE